MDNAIQTSLQDVLNNLVQVDEYNSMRRVTTKNGVTLCAAGTVFEPFTLECSDLLLGFVPAMLYADRKTQGMDAIVRLSSRPNGDAVLTGRFGPGLHEQPNRTNGRSVVCNLEPSSEAQCWLNLDGRPIPPKKMIEFIEDHGHVVNSHNRLDLIQALRKLKLTKDASGSIEYRPTGETAQFRIDTEVKTASETIELPTMLTINAQMWIGANVRITLDVRVNYSVDNDNGISVRLLPVNPELQIHDAVERLSRDVDGIIQSDISPAAQGVVFLII